jgi:hypothetical protein
MRSEIDLNPSRYVLLNGLPADKDPNMKTGEIKPNDSAAYYPFYDASKHPDEFHTPIKKKDHTQNVIYQKDKSAYYGPNPSKTFVQMDQEGTKVKVQMADLDKIFPTVDNIVGMSRELDKLNSPKQLDSKKQLYAKDSGAYYDPTSADLAKKKTDLTKALNEMKNKLKESQNTNVANSVTIVEKKPYTIVQNKINSDVEGSNKFIADNYHTVVPIYQEPKKKNETASNNNPNSVPAPKVEAKVILGKTESSTSASLNNNDRESPAITIGSLNTKPTSSSTVGTNVINPNSTNSMFSNSQLKMRRTEAPHPDTQGMRTERVRIVSLRKS